VDSSPLLNPATLDRLDSLMVAGELSTVRDSLIQYDQHMTRKSLSFPEHYEYNQQKQLYMQIFASVRYLQTRNDPSFHELLVKSVRDYFTPENAGPVAALKFKDLLADLDTLAVSRGIEKLGIAYLLKERYQEVTRTDASENDDFLREILIADLERKMIQCTLSDSSRMADSLAVESDIPGAAVFWDQVYKGRTPLYLAKPSDKVHLLTVYKAGTDPFWQFVGPGHFPARLKAVIGKAWITILPLPGATMVLDDTLNVSCGLTHHGVMTGMHSMEIRDFPGHENMTFKIDIPSLADTLIVPKLQPKTKKKAVAYALLFPGLGHRYMEQPEKATTLFLTEMTLLTALLGTRMWISQLNQEPEDFWFNYEDELLEKRFSIKREQNIHLDAQIKQVKRMQNLFLGMAAGVWIYSLINVAFFEPAEPFLSDPEFGLQFTPTVNPCGFGFTWHF
jgi:hypothetical protein